MYRDPKDKNPFDNDKYRSKVGPIQGVGFLAIPLVIATIWILSQCG